jgi:hypothetical protein
VNPASIVKIDSTVQLEIAPLDPCMKTEIENLPTLNDMYTFLEELATVKK